MKISILTATYNRANYLRNLYKSIEQNTLRTPSLECEWIIVDDGSEDETEKKVREFIKEEKIKIRYYYQKNSGKMEAINQAVKMSEGDLIIDCDSDDYLCSNAFELIEKKSNELFKSEELYALAFLKKDKDGKISGKNFLNIDKPTTMFELYFKEDIEGEKILVYKAKIRKEYKHELEENENFITEARMYHKMDEKYKILCINECIEIGEYVEDGYTKNIKDTFKNSPKGYYCYFKEILGKDMKGTLIKKRIYAIKHYILFGYLAQKGFNIKSIRNINNKIAYLILYIPGIIKSKKFLIC